MNSITLTLNPKWHQDTVLQSSPSSSASIRLTFGAAYFQYVEYIIMSINFGNIDMIIILFGTVNCFTLNYYYITQESGSCSGNLDIYWPRQQH